MSLTPLLALALGATVAAALALLIEDEVRVDSSPGLVVGVFATFLTSTSIIAAFSIDGKSRWPTPWETLDRARVPAWFLVALVSVVVALVATAIDNAFLGAFGLTLALVGLLLGARGLWGLFSLSSDRGRHALIVDLLSSSIRRSAPSPDQDHEPDLGEVDTEDHVSAWFLSAGSHEGPMGSGVSIELVPAVLRLYADRRDLDAIVRLVDEVLAAATQALDEDDWGGFDRYLERIDTLLSVLRNMFDELAGRVLSGRLGDPAARGALVRVSEAAIDVAGRSRKPPGSSDPGEGRKAEILVARHLTALCRLAGAVAAEAESTLAAGEVAPAAGGPEWARLRALCATCVNLQQAARWAVDPDPPGMKLPADHPWRTGLSSAEGALVWLWGAAESPSGPYGVGLYALCEILTGRKFFGSYWEGYDVFTEIECRLSESLQDPTVAASRATLDRAGGLERVALELAATRLAGIRPRLSAASADAARGSDDRHVACELFLAGGGYKPVGRDPIEDLAWLLTDRLGGSLWTMVHGQLGQLQDPTVRPPLRTLYRHPGACALAIALRLAPLERGAGEWERLPLLEFTEKLPAALLDETTVLARALTGTGEAESRSEQGDRAHRLVAATEFVRKLVPGSPPGLDAPVGGGSLRSDRDAAERPVEPPARLRGPDGFAEVLQRLAARGSEIELDMIQCDTRWLEEWAELRSALDAALLAAALDGRVRIRRILRFNLSGEADRRSTRLHYRWTDALSTAAGCFEQRAGGADAEPSRYRVRQLILPFADPGASPPADSVVLRGDGLNAPDPESVRNFEATWTLFDRDARITARGLGLVDLAGRGSPGPA